jgi:hypothetical protein
VLRISTPADACLSASGCAFEAHWHCEAGVEILSTDVQAGSLATQAARSESHLVLATQCEVDSPEARLSEPAASRMVREAKTMLCNTNRNPQHDLRRGEFGNGAVLACPHLNNRVKDCVNGLDPHFRCRAMSPASRNQMQLRCRRCAIFVAFGCFLPALCSRLGRHDDGFCAWWTGPTWDTDDPFWLLLLQGWFSLQQSQACQLHSIQQQQAVRVGCRRFE